MKLYIAGKIAGEDGYEAKFHNASLEVPPEGVSYNVMGAAMNSMARKGLIEFTGRMKLAQRVSLHASLLSEWRLVKYPERA